MRGLRQPNALGFLNSGYPLCRQQDRARRSTAEFLRVYVVRRTVSTIVAICPKLAALHVFFCGGGGWTGVILFSSATHDGVCGVIFWWTYAYAYAYAYAYYGVLVADAPPAGVKVVEATDYDQGDSQSQTIVIQEARDSQ